MDTIVAIFFLCFVSSSYGHIGCCDDHHPQCQEWAQKDLCSTQQFYMVQNCPRACQKCLDNDLFDRDMRCPTWEMKGACQLDRVKRLCPHSCNLCNTRETTIQYAKSITRPDFQCGIPYYQNQGGGFSPGAGHRTGTRSGAARYSNSEGRKLTAVLESNIPDVQCGATVISDRYLLTAAHCVTSNRVNWNTIQMGEIDLMQRTRGRSNLASYEIEDIIYHPEYKLNSRERYNDIAIVKTRQPMQFSELVYPICVTSKFLEPNTPVKVQGFGLINETTSSTHLQEATLYTVSQADCERAYEREGSLAHLQLRYPNYLQGTDIICAGAPGKDACQGDSGGPLFAEDRDGRRFLVGIVSGGKDCGSVLPGIYVSVADHINFIDQELYPN